MLPREFDLRVRLWNERQQRDLDDRWSRALMIYNQIGGGFGGRKYEPLSLERLKEMAEEEAAGPPPVEEYRASQRRLREIEAREAAAKNSAKT